MEIDLNKLQAEKTALQRALSKEREEKMKVSERLEEVEAACKRKTEEIEALQLCNNQLIHRCEALQEKHNQKGNNWGWWGAGKAQKIEERIKVLEDELANKISENEQVHIKIFDQRQRHKDKVKEIKARLTSSEDFVRRSAEKIEQMSIEIAQYQNSVRNLLKENKEYLGLLEDKNKEIQDSQAYYVRVSNELKDKIGFLQSQLRAAISLDLTDFERFSKYSSPKFSKNYQFKQNEWLAKVLTSVSTGLPLFKSSLQKYSKRIEAIFSASAAKNPRIITEFQSASDKCCDTYSALIKSAIESPYNQSELARLTTALESRLIYLIRVFQLLIRQESEIIQDFDKVSKVNKDLLSISTKLSGFISRLSGFLTLSCYSVKTHWPKTQELSKGLLSTLTESLKLLSERLSLDKSISFKFSLKETNDPSDLISELARYPSMLSYFSSELMQLKPNFYYCLNPQYHSTASYLSKLREISYTPGIAYNQSIANIQILETYESKSREQLQAIATLEKHNIGLQKEIERSQNEITRIENELAAVEQNGERSHLETGKDLLHEPESISEDVKSGAQRFAIRLTGADGEPVPLSELSISNDIYYKIQELAVNKIHELSAANKKSSL